MIRLILLAIAGWNACAQPLVLNIGNDASMGRNGMKNWAVAPGSLIRITGARLGPSATVNAEGFPLPLELEGTSVQLRNIAATMPAYLLSVSETVILALVPSTFPAGLPTTLTVATGGQVSAAIDIGVQLNNLGIYTVNQAGTGPAAADNLAANDDGSLRTEKNTLLTPARPGDALAILGTGLGAVTGDERSATLPGDLAVPLRIFVGPNETVIRSKGRSDRFPGKDVVVIEVPAGIEGCYVPLVAMMNDVVSNHSTISIASSGACTDPTGLTAEELTQISERGNAAIGSIALTRYVEDLTRNPFTSERASAAFSQFSVSTLLASYGIFGLPAPGTCIMNPERRNQFYLTDPVVPDRLDGGSVLNLAGPQGTRAIAKDSTGTYTTTLRRAAESDRNIYLAPGDYTIDNGEGGADVGPFQASFSIPSRVNWTNRATSAPTSRTSLTMVTWTGGPEDGYVLLTEHVENRAVAVNSVCLEKATVGMFRDPEYIGETIPIEGGVFGTLPGTVTLATVPKPVRFTAPGIDFGLIFIAIGEGYFVP